MKMEQKQQLPLLPFCWLGPLHLGFQWTDLSSSSSDITQQVLFSLWARSTSLESSHHWPVPGSVVGQHRKCLYTAMHEHMNTHPHQHTHFAVDLCTMWTYDIICFKYCFLCYPFPVMHNMLYKMFCRLNFPAVLIFCTFLNLLCF